MSPEAIGLALFVLQEAIKNAPTLAAELQALFSKGAPSPADWAALRARIQAGQYADFVPATKLPPEER